MMTTISTSLLEKVIHTEGVRIASFIYRNSNELRFLPNLYEVLQEYTESLVEGEIRSRGLNPHLYIYQFIFPGQVVHQQEDIDELKGRIETFVAEHKSTKAAWKYLRDQFRGVGGKEDFSTARAFVTLRTPLIPEIAKHWTSWHDIYKPVLWEVFKDANSINKYGKRDRHQRLVNELVKQKFQIPFYSKLKDKYLRGNSGYGVEDVVAMIRISDLLVNDSDETFKCYRSQVNKRYFFKRAQGFDVEKSLDYAFKPVHWIVNREEEFDDDDDEYEYETPRAFYDSLFD